MTEDKQAREIEELLPLRRDLQAVDEKLLSLLAQRYDLVLQVKEYKRQVAMPVLQKEVQERKLAQVAAIADNYGKLSTITAAQAEKTAKLRYLQLVLRLLMDLSVSEQLDETGLLSCMEAELTHFEEQADGKIITKK